MRFFLDCYYLALCLLRSGLFILLKFFSSYHPWLHSRMKFESKNTEDSFCRSFFLDGKKAEIAFEVSSEGELEQIRPVLFRVLDEKINVELLYSSESVEKKCRELASSYTDNLRILRLPLLSFSLIPWSGSQNLFKWMTAKTLVLCRYDFFPELMLFGGMSEVSFVLLSATLKNKKVNGIFYPYYRLLYGYFDLIVSATEKDQQAFERLGIQESKLCTFDFRVVQIKSRLQQAFTKWEQLPFFKAYVDYLNKVKLQDRLLLGSAWPIEMRMFADRAFIEKIVSNQMVLTIAPHKLNKEFIDEIVTSISQYTEGETLPIYILNKDVNLSDTENILNQLTNSPGILINCVPGILCESYSLYGHVFVGGGHTRSIHSVLEPYLGMANIYCGPLVHRSTEYDFVLYHSPEAIIIVEQLEKFFNVFLNNQSKVVDRENRQRLMDSYSLNFDKVYERILARGGKREA